MRRGRGALGREAKGHRSPETEGRAGEGGMTTEALLAVIAILIWWFGSKIVDKLDEIIRLQREARPDAL